MQQFVSVLAPTNSPALPLVGLLATAWFATAPALAQAPYLTATTPPRNAVAASGSAAVSLAFSQPVTAATASAIRLHSVRAGGAKRATYAVNGAAVVVSPLTAFLPGETVAVTVPAAVQSAGGAAARASVYQFTTAVGGSGEGLFGASPTIPDVPLRDNGSTLTMGDVDGDGDLDLLVCCTSCAYTGSPTDGTVGVWFNIGLNSGNYVSGPVFTVGDYPRSVALGDVDGDGDLDAVVVNQDGLGNRSSVKIRLNDGQGNFRASAASPDPTVDLHIAFLALGDVDGDGDLDFVLNNPAYPSVLGAPAVDGSISVRLNQGLNSGNFVSPASNAEVAMGPIAVAALTLGDVDGDGDLDLLADSDTNILLRLNDGSGNFQAPATNATIALGGSINYFGLYFGHAQYKELGDVDHDGDLDLVVATAVQNGSGQFGGVVKVLLNSGLNSGQFIVPPASADVAINNFPRNLALGDVDGDGDLDVVTANYGNDVQPYTTSNTISIRTNDGRGHFAAPPVGANPNVGVGPRNLALGDIDGDGDLDVVTIGVPVPGTFQSNLAVSLNQGPAAFFTTISPSSGLVGSRVTLTGTDFTGATAVSFNGTAVPAGSFSVVSPTTISTVVPTGARSGPVFVTTPRGVQTSFTPFALAPLGTAETKLGAALAVYPNPARALLIVEVPAVAGASQVQATLLSVLGQEIMHQSAALPATGTRLTMPVAALAQGVYQLRLQIGATTTSRRVMVE